MRCQKKCPGVVLIPSQHRTLRGPSLSILSQTDSERKESQIVFMTDFLKNSLSVSRWQTYERLSKDRGLSAEELYHRNIVYSKELYVILAGLEVVLRNAFHNRLSIYFKRDDWMSLDMANNLFMHQHKKQLDKAIKNVTKNKDKDFCVPDLVAELNFGFWAHLTNAPYEQKLWAPALRRCFVHKFGRPVRQDIESRLKELLKLRNKIAHLEPIIRQEKQLIQAYKNAYDIISWICPETAEWFDKRNSLNEFWRTNNLEGKTDHEYNQ